MGTLEITRCLWANAAKEADLSEHSLMERPTPNASPAELPESEGNAEPEGMPDSGFTDDEIESITQSIDPTLRAILGLC